MSAYQMSQDFMALSSELCGFSVFTLRGTGYAGPYFATLTDMVGPELVDELLAAYRRLPVAPEERDRALRAQILSDEALGPIARNIIKLWYTSIWFELPAALYARVGTGRKNERFIPFTYAYPEGLLAPAVGAHVQGAKAPGYGSWSEPPILLEFDGDPMLGRKEP
jgi:hypothetical protein